MKASTACLVLGLLLFASGVAAAPLNIASSPSWQQIALWALGGFFALGSMYVKGMSSRISTIEERQRSLSESLLSEYNTKHEIQVMLERIERETRAVHQRLDLHGYPPSRGGA